MPPISGTPDLQTPAVLGARCSEPWPLNGPCGLFFAARYALFHALRVLGLGRNDGILVPAYCCGTEIDPILAAGVRIEWCDVEESLDVTERMLQALRTQECRAILLTHYFGLNRLSEELVRHCRARGILIIEDCTHAFLSRDEQGRALGSTGDAAVFSLRKSLGIPDGGVLVFNRGLADTVGFAQRLSKPNRVAVWYRALELVRRGSTWGVGVTRTRRGARSLARMALWSRIPLRAFHMITGLGGGCLVDPNGYRFESRALSWGMSTFTKKRLNCNYQRVLQTRRENFLLLQQLAMGIPEAKPLLPDLPAGACPLLFPIVLPDRAIVRNLLAYGGIDSHPWWGYFHPAVPWDRFPVARRLKAQVLGLPVHQGLTRVHIEREADGLRQALLLARHAV